MSTHAGLQRDFAITRASNCPVSYSRKLDQTGDLVVASAPMLSGLASDETLMRLNIGAKNETPAHPRSRTSSQPPPLLIIQIVTEHNQLWCNKLDQGSISHWRIHEHPSTKAKAASALAMLARMDMQYAQQALTPGSKATSPCEQCWLVLEHAVLPSSTGLWM
jgi:hypothetical protein